MSILSCQTRQKLDQENFMKNSITAKQTAKILNLHSKGKSQREIAEAIGRSRSGVLGVLKRAGLVKAKKSAKLHSKSEARRLAVQKKKR